MYSRLEYIGATCYDVAPEQFFKIKNRDVKLNTVYQRSTKAERFKSFANTKNCWKTRIFRCNIFCKPSVDFVDNIYCLTLAIKLFYVHDSR